MKKQINFNKIQQPPLIQDAHDTQTHPRLLKSKQRKINVEGFSFNDSFREIYPMFNNSFIIWKKNIIIHTNQDGKILETRVMQNQIKKIFPMTDSSLLIFQIYQKALFENQINKILAFKITQWDLKTSQTIEIYHYNTRYQNHQIFEFNQTKIFCIVEQEFKSLRHTIYYEDKKFQSTFYQQQYQVLDSVAISYYQFPLKKHGDNFLDFKFLKGFSQCCLKVFKLDNHSKIGIAATSLNSKNQTFIKEVCCGSRTWNTIPIKFGKFLSYDKQWFEPKITLIYEYKKGHYYLKVEVKASRIQYLFRRKKCDLAKDLQGLEKTFSLTFNPQTKQLKYLVNDQSRHQVQFTESFRKLQLKRFIKRQSFQKRSERNEDPLLQEIFGYEILPVYYIDNITESIIYKGKKNSLKYYPQHTPNQALKVQIEGQSINYCHFKTLIPQLNYVYFLTQYLGLEMVDDKLVSSVVQLLQINNQDTISWLEFD